MPENLTATLAEFVATTQFEDLPDNVRERTKLIVLDAVASALAGSQSGDTGHIEGAAAAVGGTGDFPVIGRTPLAAAGAMLVNGYFVTATTVCDVYLPALCHVTPEVLPPALGMGVTRKVSGAQFLLAFALGLEMTTRISLGSNYGVFRGNGWHSPGVFGPFGGATAAGKLAGFDQNRMVNAFGLAGSQSAGTFAHWGTPTIKFHQARGALSGYLAVLLAERGFTASADILTSVDGGIYSAYSDGGDPEVAVAGLGERWELSNISLRLWPLASSLQAMATALFEFLKDPTLTADDIAHVRIGLSKQCYEMHGDLTWENRFKALLSAQYIAAVILRDRACWLDQFTPARIQDPTLDAYARDRVSVSVDDSVLGTGAYVELECADGRVLRDHRKVARGEPTDPVSMADVAAKFALAAGPVLGADQAAATLQRLQTIDELPEIDAALFGCLR